MVEPPTSFSTHGKTESLQVLRFDMGLHEFGAVLPDPGTRHAAKIRKSARLQEEYLEQSGLAGLAIVVEEVEKYLCLNVVCGSVDENLDADMGEHSAVFDQTKAVGIASF